MATVAQTASGPCPFASGPERNDSKSAALAAQRVRIEEGAEPVRAYEQARRVLLDKTLLQGGAGADSFDASDIDASPVFFLDGEPHRKKRGAIAHFFTPKAIDTRYHEIIERETERLLAQLRRDGRARLDVLSFELTVAVAGNIVGLTSSDVPAMAKRLATILSGAFAYQLGFFGRVAFGLRRAAAMVGFYLRDVRPAVRARRQRPQEDIISQMLERGASRKAILVECMTYAAAGMVTTREFIVMAAWHLLERPELLEGFLAADDKRQLAILLEILRLEPIASLLYRRSDPDQLSPRTKYALDLRAVLTDEDAVGSCPHALDPDRAERTKTHGALLSFGAGAHHCPGRHVALHEARVFLDAMLRLPGIALERPPDLGWSELLMSYELRDAVVSCDRDPSPRDSSGVRP